MLGCWWEDGFDPAKADGFVEAFRDAMAAYLRFGGARTVDWAPGLSKERRLLGRAAGYRSSSRPSRRDVIDRPMRPSTVR